jgi:hypothetical protein
MTNGGGRSGRGLSEPERAAAGASGRAGCRAGGDEAEASVGLTDRSTGPIWSG